MAFNVLLLAAFGVFLAGTLYRVYRWFSGGITEADRSIPAAARMSQLGAAVRKGLSAQGVKSLVLGIFKGVVLDTLLLARLFRTDKVRWAAHMLIFWGFMLLLVFHAFEDTVSLAIWSEYQSTLNPWFFLREVLGFMVIAGVALMVYRKRILARVGPRILDPFTLALLGTIIVSGYFLEGAKIGSRSEFIRMVEEYYSIDETEDVAALEAFWVTEYGLTSSKVSGPFSEEQLELGREVNDYCIECHVKPSWAFGSYAVSKVLSPVTKPTGGAFVVTFFYWLHVLACFLGLAWLPFGKMFHAIISPLSCIAGRLREGPGWAGQPKPALLAVRRMMDLDACTRCGLCSDRCSVGLAANTLGNPYILPRTKLQALEKTAARVRPADGAVNLLDGLTVCTNCTRCTDVCPVGINLQDIWEAAREDLSSRLGATPLMLSPLSVHRAQEYAAQHAVDSARLEEKRNAVFGAQDEVLVSGSVGGVLANMSDPGDFSLCYNCKTCTSSCPIVSMEEAPVKELGLLPHQIVHATAHGFDDLVESSAMLWSCLGCYRCQELCPQEVRVTDIIYAHKNAAIAKMLGKRKD